MSTITRYHITLICIQCILVLTTVIDAVENTGSETILGESFCKNTVGGRWNLTDSTGRVCGRHDMDFSTGCCPDTSHQYSCESCMERDGCCSSYEYCVSCCMSPRHVPTERMKETYIGLFKSDTGHWTNEFEYCSSACRTTSRSTEHENAYIGERKFCFSEDRRPRDSDPVTFETMDTFIADGSSDASCETVCKQRESRCVGDEDMYAMINTCDELRRFFPCEAGCFESQKEEDDVYPGYVSNSAKKEENPATCYTASSEKTEMRRRMKSSADVCQAKSGPVQRLCVCSRSPAKIGDDISSPKDDDANGTTSTTAAAAEEQQPQQQEEE